jgi:hypothetical protein
MAGAPAFGQMFTAGVRGGYRFGTGGLDPFTVGPTFEFKPPILPLRLTADVLYKRANTGTQSFTVWDFPLIVRFEVPTPLLKPFFGAGPSFRRYGISASDNFVTGFAFGTGIRWTAPFVKITPEVRVSTFPSTSFRGRDTQSEVLIGVTF